MIDSGKLPVTDRKGKIPAEDTKCALCSNLIWSVFISLFAVLFYRTEFKFVALHDWDTIIKQKHQTNLNERGSFLVILIIIRSGIHLQLLLVRQIKSQ